MSRDEGHGLGGTAGGLLRIFSVTGTALIAPLVGWDFARRVKLEIRVVTSGAVLGMCVGGIVGAFVPVLHVSGGVLCGVAVGVALGAIAIGLAQAASKE